MHGSDASWVPVAPDSDFPLANLPYGVFLRAGEEPRLGAAIGDAIFDLSLAAQEGLFEGVADARLLQAETLNPLLGAGRGVWTSLRARLTDLLRADSTAIAPSARDGFLVERDAVRMLKPFEPGDYVDFYSSLEHATNLGKILRPGSEALLPNWRHIPIGYHGRSSTIVVDGTPIVRPNGQRKPPTSDSPLFGPSTKLDIELE